MACDHRECLHVLALPTLLRVGSWSAGDANHGPETRKLFKACLGGRLISGGYELEPSHHSGACTAESSLLHFRAGCGIESDEQDTLSGFGRPSTHCLNAWMALCCTTSTSEPLPRRWVSSPAGYGPATAWTGPARRSRPGLHVDVKGPHTLLPPLRASWSDVYGVTRSRDRTLKMHARCSTCAVSIVAADQVWMRWAWLQVAHLCCPGRAAHGG